MSLRLNLPAYVSLLGTQFRSLDTNVKRIVNRREWEDVFRLGREYGIHRPAFSRALSWYRKGVTSEDPIDKLIAFWSSLEGVGSKFARCNDRTNQGAINQICDCFDQLWTEITNWKVIPNDAQWVNRFHELRNGIAHGFMPVDVNSIRAIAKDLPKLRALAYAFLLDWEVLRPQNEL